MKLSSGWHISLPGVLGFVTSAVGVLTHPTVFALLPAKAATVVAVTGIVVQAITRPVVHDPLSGAAPGA